MPLDDSWPGRAGPQFSYAAHKVELEAMLVRFAAEHPQIAVSCVRPCIVGGPRMDNYLRHLLFKMPIIVLLDRVDAAIQLVHEDDVSAAIHRILVRQGTGTYNLAPPDAISHLGDRRVDRPAADECSVLAGMAFGLDGVEDAFSPPQVSAGFPVLSPSSLVGGLQPAGRRVGISISAFQPRDFHGNA